ncbi:MAG: hypothetical protein HY052_02145 [Proteobacteria bacterium]|nr:hypothetical protein [Pseudomonadota bacterium]
MFGSDKKKKEKAAQLAAENIVRQKVEEIEKISDAAERYLAFAGLESNMSGVVKDAQRQVDAKDYDSNSEIFKPVAMIGGGAIGTIGGTALLAATGFAAAPFLFVLAPLAFGITLGIREAAMDDTIRRRDEFTQELSKNITHRKEALLQDDALPTLTVSPRFDELYNKFPAVKEAFTRAAMKENFTPIVRLDKPSYRPLDKRPSLSAPTRGATLKENFAPTLKPDKPPPPTPKQ